MSGFKVFLPIENKTFLIYNVNRYSNYLVCVDVYNVIEQKKKRLLKRSLFFIRKELKSENWEF
jgi:hypothetical protein